MTERKPFRRPIWQRVLFGVSLALNVLVISAVLGLLIAGGRRGDDRPPPPLRMGGVAPMIGVLPPDARHEVLGQLRAIGRDHGVSRDTLDSIRQRTVAAITADPFDAPALMALLQEGQDRFTAYNGASFRLLVEQLAAMSPAERRAYAERLSKFQRMKRPFDKGGHDRPPRD